MRITIIAAAMTAALWVMGQPVGSAEQRVKLRGYITDKSEGRDVKVLADVVHWGPATKLEIRNAPPGKQSSPEGLSVGMLIEAEGSWMGKHQFAAQKVTCDWEQFDREIKEEAVLEPLPKQVSTGQGRLSSIAVDGELLVLEGGTKISGLPGEGAPSQETSAQEPGASAVRAGTVHYRGIRRADGFIEAKEVEIDSPPPGDAYEIGHGMKVVRDKDPKTGIEIVEFRKEKKVVGRLKLFPVKEVQDYVVALGTNMLPQGIPQSVLPAEFRFYVIEDASINASALPDGTVLVNTGLLGAIENEAQLAFVLSHEIAHVVQAHHWRQVHETRSKRVLLTIAGIAGSYFVGDLGVFLGQLGMLAVWNGYGRRLENQADRLGLQNMMDHGYDPRQAPRFSEIIIDRYGNRSTSAIWSNHDSSVLRGSFLAVQILRRFPGEQFQQKKADTQAFRDMKEAMGPVKIM